MALHLKNVVFFRLNSLMWACATLAGLIFVSPVIAQGPPSGVVPGNEGAVLGFEELPQEPPMTPAQEFVSNLTPPGPGGLIPVPPLGPEDPKPTADPRDFNGVWYHNQKLEFRMERDMYGARVPYTMKGAKVLARRVNAMDKGTPFQNASSICRPPGPQWQRDLNMPFFIFQSENWIEFVFEEYHGRWKVVLDAEAAPPPDDAEYMGYSVGHWDGNTLVVETKNFKQDIWLDVDGTPLSKGGKLIQRIRKVEQGPDETILEIITTIIDPQYYTRPWSVVRSFGWQSNRAIFKEYNCEEQIGDPYLSSDAGLISEPD